MTPQEKIKYLENALDTSHKVYDNLNTSYQAIKRENSDLKKRVDTAPKTGLLDKNGKEIKEGDMIAVPYYYPDGSTLNEVDFIAKVVFFNGAFGYHNKTDFVLLFDWQKVEKGDYVPNEGNKRIYTGITPLWIINE